MYVLQTRPFNCSVGLAATPMHSNFSVEYILLQSDDRNTDSDSEPTQFFITSTLYSTKTNKLTVYIM
jgi:hypothetical protein